MARRVWGEAHKRVVGRGVHLRGARHELLGFWGAPRNPRQRITEVAEGNAEGFGNVVVEIKTTRRPVKTAHENLRRCRRGEHGDGLRLRECEAMFSFASVSTTILESRQAGDLYGTLFADVIIPTRAVPMSDMNMASLVAHVKNAVRQTPVLGIPLVLVSLCLLAAAIVLAPFAAPLAIAYFFLNRSSEESGAKVASLSSGTKTGVTAVPKTPVTTTTVPLSTATSSKDTTAPAETAPPAPAPLTGSAALMAKMRKSGAVTGEKRAATGADTSVSTKASATKASAPPTIVDNNTDSRFFILYGGEASTQIARDLSDKAVANGFAPRLFAMDDFKQCDLCQTPCTAIFVVETIENAQPAEAAGTCLRFFNRKRKSGEKDSLRGVLTYAVLGLGDTNLLLDRQTTTAKDCNQAAQTLDSALLFLGAEKLVTRGECNDAAGLEQAFEPWCKTLFPALAKALSSDGADAASTKNDGADTNAAIQTASIDAPASSPSIKFLYGSQTGNASEICVSMAAEAAGAKGFANVTGNSMNEKDVTDCLAPGNILVFVVSSTGDGDAPDNCDMFFTRLKRAAKAKTGGSVGVGTQYTVLGLGDQNYTAFMAVPRAFSTFMEKAGATAFYPRGEADDTLGLYEYAEVWQDALWEPLRKAVDDAPAFKLDPVKMAQEAAAVKALAKAVVDEEKAAEKARKEMAKESAEAKVEMAKEVTTKDAVPSTVETATPQPVQTATPSKIEGIPALPACRTHVKWLDAGKETAVYPIGGSVAKGDDAAFTAASPFLARVSAKTRMTAPESDRRVLHVEFDLTGGNNNSIGGDTKSTGCNTNSSLDYQPGDSIGVLPMNDSSLVAKIAKRLNLDLTSVFTCTWCISQIQAHCLLTQD